MIDRKINLIFALTLLLFFISLPDAAAAGAAVDPYEIYRDYYNALGGLEKVKGQQTLYYEAEITVSGLKGTLKERIHYAALRWTIDLDLNVFRHRQGYNGKIAWIVDSNGKLQVQKDETSEKRRRLRKLMERRAFLDRESTCFKLAYLGTEKVGDTPCRVVRLTNTINDDVLSEYFNLETKLKEKSILKDSEGEEHTLYSDYRPVQGILRPFKRHIHILPTGQRQEIRVLKYEVDAPVSASIFDPPREDAADFEFTMGKSSQNIPFDFIENHIYLTVNVKGKQGLWVLDSGAAISVMDFDFAREIGLKPEGSMRGQGVGNPVDMSFVTIPEYTLPGILFKSQKIGCLKFKNILTRYIGFPIAGILGYDFLSRFITRIDYAAEKLSFYHPDFFVYRGPGKKVDAPLRGNSHSLPLTVDGKYAGLWSVDLGANGLTFNYPYAKEHNLTDLPGIYGIAGGAGGIMREKNVQFKSVEMAGFVVSKPRIGFPIREVKGGLSSKEFIGNAGNSLFRHFVLYLDYKHQQVIVEKGADFDKAFPENKSGLSLMLNDEDLIEVLYIIPGSAADKAGFKEGDIIKRIAGVAAADYPDLVKLRELFYKEDGTGYIVEVERQGKIQELKLVLYSLFTQPQSHKK